MSGERILSVLVLLSAAAIILALIPTSVVVGVSMHHNMAKDRAMECSAMLHGYSAGTLIPLTEDASIEIGACLLQFNQPLATGEDG